MVRVVVRPAGGFISSAEVAVRRALGLAGAVDAKRPTIGGYVANRASVSTMGGIRSQVAVPVRADVPFRRALPAAYVVHTNRRAVGRHITHRTSVAAVIDVDI